MTAGMRPRWRRKAAAAATRSSRPAGNASRSVRAATQSSTSLPVQSANSPARSVSARCRWARVLAISLLDHVGRLFLDHS